MNHRHASAAWWMLRPMKASAKIFVFVVAATALVALFLASTRPIAAQGPDLCGAPKNQFGYTLCSTKGNYEETRPAAGFCDSFPCTGQPPEYQQFWSGTGYVVECSDGRYSLSGGTPESCQADGVSISRVYGTFPQSYACVGSQSGGPNCIAQASGNPDPPDAGSGVTGSTISPGWILLILGLAGMGCGCALAATARSCR
jgi:hypothetical protein